MSAIRGAPTPSGRASSALSGSRRRLTQPALSFWGESEHNRGTRYGGGEKSGAVALYETTSEDPRSHPLMPRERQALEAIVQLIAASTVGFDGALLDAIRDVLLGTVELDGMSILVESEDGASFRVAWQSYVGGAGIAPLALGE